MGTGPKRRDRSDLGEQYIRAMTLVRQYAYAGGDWVCDRVTRMLRAQIIESEQYWVVRKGATPAFPCQKGFVVKPGVILEGIESEESRLAMYSSERMKSLRN
jgi:tRNA-splicing ligase RtcB